MRWRPRGRRSEKPVTGAPRTDQAARDPLVLAITEPVTRQTAANLVARVNRVAASNRVVIDLTGIPDFDSEGAAALVGLQESLGPERLTILGFRQATARIVGADSDLGLDLDTDSAAALPRPAGEWALRRLHAISVIQTKGDGPVSIDGLEPLLHTALAEDVGIVVVDLRNAELTRGGIDVIAFASSSAALRGQELLVVNVDAATGEDLRHAGLSATTYVAPEPLD
jgi:anti-anti-sigma regulatory factor